MTTVSTRTSRRVSRRFRPVRALMEWLRAGGKFKGPDSIGVFAARHGLKTHDLEQALVDNPKLVERIRESLRTRAMMLLGRTTERFHEMLEDDDALKPRDVVRIHEAAARASEGQQRIGGNPDGQPGIQINLMLPQVPGYDEPRRVEAVEKAKSELEGLV